MKGGTRACRRHSATGIWSSGIELLVFWHRCSLSLTYNASNHLRQYKCKYFQTLDLPERDYFTKAAYTDRQWSSFDGADYKHLKLGFCSESTTGETSPFTDCRQSLRKLLLITLKIDFVNTSHSLHFKTHNLDVLAVGLGFIYSVLVYYLLQESAHCAVEGLGNNLQF